MFSSALLSDAAGCIFEDKGALKIHSRLEPKMQTKSQILNSEAGGDQN